MTTAPPSAAGPGRTFSRIRKQGDTNPQPPSQPYFQSALISTAGDLADELEALAIRKGAATKQKPTSTAPSSRPPGQSSVLGPSTSGSLLKSSTQNSIKQNPPYIRQLSSTSTSTSNTQQSSGSATTATCNAPDSHPKQRQKPVSKLAAPLDPKCLVLGDNRECHLSPELSTILYPHQVEGVTWLYGLWKVGAGGILADDMGLGKTMQTSAFLSGVLKNKLARRVLVLAPTTLIATWEKE